MAHGAWIATRAYADEQQAAHTTPVYVSVNADGFHDPAVVKKYLQLSKKYLNELKRVLRRKEENPELQAWRYRKPLEKRISAVKKIIRELHKKLR